MIRHRFGWLAIVVCAGSGAFTWVLAPRPAAAIEAVSSVQRFGLPQRQGPVSVSGERKRAYGLSAVADLARAGGSSGVATGGGLVLGVVTGPVAGIPTVGPGLADQATKAWGTLQSSIGRGSATFADALSQAAEPLAPGLNQASAPVVSAADSLASSAAAAEQHLRRFGLRTNLLSYPFGTGAQLAHALG